MNKRLKNQRNDAALIPAHPLDNLCFSYEISPLFALFCQYINI